jgi:glycerate kinase
LFQFNRPQTIVTMEERALEDFEKSDGALRTIKDLGAGAAGGIAQVLLGKLLGSFVVSSRGR